MSKINILDKSVYNRISAGEVVENPASIVKELVENAIDAGSDYIEISIESGGIKSIIVTDNGSGMEEDDLRLSIMPHSTSKIANAEDLDTIGTLGFRGEALASIAAVSETTIKSKYFESNAAHYIEVKGGDIVGQGVCGHNIGTQIAVKNLFYNTPARYKFLKNAKGEENNITSLVAELIFANQDISFTYIVDGKPLYRTHGEGLLTAIKEVYGDDIADSCIPFFIEEKGYKISGYTARPATDAIRNNRMRQIFIVNGRVIKDATISAVVQNAYGEFLMKRTFPTVIIDVIMPFGLVDVNVHPNKKEVRFAEPKVINGLIYHAVKNAVEEDAKERQKVMFEALHSSIDHDTVTAVGLDNTYKWEQETIIEEEDEAKTNDKTGLTDALSSLYSRPKAYNPRTTLTFEDSITSYENVKEDKRPYKIIGQLFDTYLLIELNGELIMIDQHAAHERILYDKLIAESEKGIAVQDLLFPYVYSINANERSLLMQNKDNLDNLGFKTEINLHDISVFTVPCILTDLDIGGFLSEIIEYNKTIADYASSNIIKDKIAKIACRRAIKGGDKLTDSQVEYVIDYLFANGVPLQCPHGRPTMIKITRDDIEKKFGRKV